jgi:regulator of cell morphogenesis and NO signaling
MSGQYENTPIANIVAHNHQTATVFERYGLDFCCGGRQSLAEACRQRQVDLGAVVAELAKVGDADVQPPADDIKSLVEHIVTRHHAYVRNALPQIQKHLAKVVAAHGERQAELTAVESHFERLASDLLLHMLKEERMLFPYICALLDSPSRRLDIFDTVQSPIRMMELEHQEAGEEMAAIRQLLNGYQPPDDACTTYRLLLAELDDFDRDLHLHVHLENNMLFPQAVALESRTLGREWTECDLSR